MSFGALLKRYRLAAGISQEALAERAGLSVQAIGALESGRRQAPYRDTVALLARALDLTAPEHAALEAGVDRRRGHLPTVPDLQPHASPPQRRPHNLPAATTALIGREQEVTRAVALVQKPEVRLLTLTGSGGVGKTRLAIEVARTLLADSPACANGAWLVELAPLADPALVVPTVAATLGLRETAGTPLLTSLSEYLADKELLLVLDNCEHLVEACAALATALLRACPHLRLLATSREGLAIGEETLHRVPSLAFPNPHLLPPVEELPAYPAVELFLRRAQARREEVVLTAHNAPAVAHVCARLDGIPLALELAAARLSAFPVESLAARLDDCFRLLMGGSRTAVPRQRTLRAMLDWSYDLLNPPEQALLRRLSVFVGGWTLEAAEAICADALQPPSASPAPATAAEDASPWSRDRSRPDSAIRPQSEAPAAVAMEAVLDLLAGLVDKSLVVLEAPGASDEAAPPAVARYRLLETVRQYGQEQLDAEGETAWVRDRHLAWYLALAEDGAVGLKGPEQLAWLRRLDVEHDNCRAALAWSTLAGTTPAEARAYHLDKPISLRLAGALFWYWDVRGHLREGLRWLETALAVGDGAESSARAAALMGAGYALALQGDSVRAETALDESLALYRALGDKAGMAQALYYLGWTAGNADRPFQGQELFEESLALCREVQDGWTSARVVRELSSMAENQAYESRGDYGQAIVLAEESVRLARVVGQPSLIARSLLRLASALMEAEDPGRAGPVLEESLGMARAVGDMGAICSAVGCTATHARRHGDVVRGRAYAEELLVRARAMGSATYLRWALIELGLLAVKSGDFERAVALATDGLALQRRLLPNADRAAVADFLMVLAVAAVAVGQPIRAVHCYSANVAIEEALFARDGPPPVRDPPTQVCEEALSTARAALGEDAFAAAWERGKALTPEDAIALALAPVGGAEDSAVSATVRSLSAPA